MRFLILRKIRDDLYKKGYKTKEEQELLNELINLGKILDIETSSLALSNKVCKTCGRPL